MCWLLSNVLIPYAIYFDSRIVGVVGIIIQAGVMVSVIYFLSRWVRAIAVQQSASFIQLNRLTAEEHAVLSYLLPLVMYIIAYSIYSLASGEVSWTKRSEIGLVFHMAIVYALYMALIRKLSHTLSNSYASSFKCCCCFNSCAWAHSPHVRRDENESPSLEADLRPLCLPRDQVMHTITIL